MDLPQIIGIVVIAWIALSALIVAVAVAAGRADTRERRSGVGSASQSFPGPQPSRARARRALAPQRAASDRRVPQGMGAAIR